MTRRSARAARRPALAATLVGAALLAAPAAQAACQADKPRDALSPQDVQAIYDCLSADLHAGYAKGPKRWIPAGHVADYRGWGRASGFPADPGVHGGRYLVTWVNQAGFDAYTRYDEEGASMPAGTVIAKESFQVSDAGAATPGPLFLMEKAAPGTSPQTGDWLYMMVSPGGAPMAVPVMQACHECHSGYEDQDFLGYPVEEARLP